MKLEDIGFYTLSDRRAQTASETSLMMRCELIVTDRCNFRCPYCRGLREDCRGDMSLEMARDTIRYWTDDQLRNIRFSGGEPTMWPHLEECVRMCRERGVERIAISTNGSASLAKYHRLVDAGVNDFSISLDACCSATGSVMAGRDGIYGRVLRTIEELSRVTYVTLGVVLTPCNKGEIKGILKLAKELGVADVRVIPSAQSSQSLSDVPLEELGEWPILRYRAQNIREGRSVRGLMEGDCSRCRLVLDDSVVAGKWHFPCVIYLREGGAPIGEVGPEMRAARARWSERVNVLKQPICSANCLDVCRDYNAKCAMYGVVSRNESELRGKANGGQETIEGPLSRRSGDREGRGGNLCLCG